MSDRETRWNVTYETDDRGIKVSQKWTAEDSDYIVTREHEGPVSVFVVSKRGKEIGRCRILSSAFDYIEGAEREVQKYAKTATDNIESYGGTILQIRSCWTRVMFPNIYPALLWVTAWKIEKWTSFVPADNSGRMQLLFDEPIIVTYAHHSVTVTSGH